MNFPKTLNSPEAVEGFEAIKTGCNNAVRLTDEIMSDHCPLNEREMHWLIMQEYLKQVPNPDAIAVVGTLVYLLIELRNERAK